MASWKKIEKLFEPVDEILHLGDVLYHGPRNPLPDGYNPAELANLLKTKTNISYVRGNCDADVDLLVLGKEDMPKIMCMTIEDIKMILIHGENIKDDEIIQLIERYDANLLAYGHTHIPRLEIVKSKIILNPGSPSLPKMNFPPTCALLEFSQNLRISIYTTQGQLYGEIFL